MKRIAFLGIGVHGLPSYRVLLNRLAQEYTIVVYSEIEMEPKWLELQHHYSLRCFKGMGLPRRIREFIFLFMLIRDQLQNPFDLIHAHSTYPTGFAAVVLQKLFRVPVVVSLDGGEGISFPEIQFGDGHHPRRTAMNKCVINHATVVTALTHFQRNEVCKYLAIRREIKVLTRGVDLKRFSFQRNYRIGSPITFLNVGYLSPIKDPETLIKAFFLIQQQIDCELIHVGKDYMNGQVQRMAKELGIAHRVHFIEPIDYDKIYEYYKKADVLLHTSLYESQAMVVAEAMASGMLVCGTHVGLISDLAGTCCVTVPTKNAEALASAVLELLTNEEKLNAMRTNAYQWSENNDMEHSAKELSALYTQLLKSE